MQFIDKAYRTMRLWAWPSQCRLCHQWVSGAICLECEGHHWRQLPRCQRCALPSSQAICAQCTGPAPPWLRSAAALAYVEPWRSLIADFKFHGDAGLTRVLSRYLLAEAKQRHLLNQNDLVLPVPLSGERLRERGFNQSLLLAQGLKHPGLLPDGLLRLRHTPPQTSLPRAQRLQNLAHAMACNPRHVQRLRKQRVLLIDDVMTTGSTLSACTQVLLNAGVEQVHVLVLARAEGQQAPQSGSDPSA